MKLVHRIAVVGLMAMATFGIALVASPAQAAPGSGAAITDDVNATGIVNCGHAWSGYNRCVALRREMVRQGYRISPLYYDPKGTNGCAVSPGCKYHFYYYS